MPVVTTVELSKGSQACKDMVRSAQDKMKEHGMTFVFAGTEKDDDTKLHTVIHFESVGYLISSSRDEELTRLRTEASAIVETATITPITDSAFIFFQRLYTWIEREAIKDFVAHRPDTLLESRCSQHQLQINQGFLARHQYLLMSTMSSLLCKCLTRIRSGRRIHKLKIPKKVINDSQSVVYGRFRLSSQNKEAPVVAAPILKASRTKSRPTNTSTATKITAAISQISYRSNKSISGILAASKRFLETC